MEELVYLADSPIQGKGLFATRAIQKGEIYLTVTGPVADAEEYNRRLEEGSIYFLEFDDDRALDITDHISRFINHACDPNSEFIEDEINKQILMFRALKNIAKDEEFTFNYNWEWDEIQGGCNCDSCGEKKKLNW